MRPIEELLAAALVGIFPSDAVFSMVVSSDERGTWDVVERHYIDGDRSGYCGYATKTIMSDIPQLEAAAVVEKLNRKVESNRAEREARFAR